MVAFLFILILLTGCDKPEVIEHPKFVRDIAPIFDKHCSACHGNRWLHEDEVIDNLDKIEYRVIINKSMPPGGTLSENERKTIANYLNFYK